MTAFDHVAIEVPDLDAFIGTVTGNGLLRVLRLGTRTGTGQRLAMLVDDHGQKVEVIEGDAVRLLHLAFEVDDVAGAHARALGAGAAEVRPPQEIPPAKAVSSMVQPASGPELQLVRYDPGSPDATRPQHR